MNELLKPEVLQILDSLPDYDEKLIFSQTSELRKQGLSAELVAAILTQSRLRTKAKIKFGNQAQQMLFTPDGLEQATRPIVTAKHAQRYVAADCRRVADLTCGIGADSQGFAAAGLQVLSVDIDPVTAEIAKWNLKNATAEVVCGDGLQVASDNAANLDGVFADPARRSTERKGKREQIYDPAAYLPPLGEVIVLQQKIPALGIKVAPVIPHDAVPPGVEAQWVSVNGEVVECGLWFGPLAQNGIGRTALLIRTKGKTGHRTVIELNQRDIEVGEIGKYIFEPDGAIIRAGLLATAAQLLTARQLDSDIAYLTGNELEIAEVPIATSYQMLDVLPFSVKLLKAYLRERNVGRVTIKKRGIAITPEQLRPQLALRGENEATLILTRIKGKQSVLVVSPIS